MSNRYKNRNLIRNNLPQYKDILKKRGKKLAVTYTTLHTIPLSDLEYAEIESIPYRWGHADKFYKVANEYYGDTSKWWVIAWFNQTPTENHLSLGDLIYIPVFPEDLMSMWGI